MISHFAEIVHNSNRILHAARVMDLPVLATEQYPKVGTHWNISVKDRQTVFCCIRLWPNTSFSISNIASLIGKITDKTRIRRPWQNLEVLWWVDWLIDCFSLSYLCCPGPGSHCSAARDLQVLHHSLCQGQQAGVTKKWKKWYFYKKLRLWNILEYTVASLFQ